MVTELSLSPMIFKLLKLTARTATPPATERWRPRLQQQRRKRVLAEQRGPDWWQEPLVSPLLTTATSCTISTCAKFKSITKTVTFSKLSQKHFKVAMWYKVVRASFALSQPKPSARVPEAQEAPHRKPVAALLQLLQSSSTYTFTSFLDRDLADSVSQEAATFAPVPGTSASARGHN